MVRRMPDRDLGERSGRPDTARYATTTVTKSISQLPAHAIWRASRVGPFSQNGWHRLCAAPLTLARPREGAPYHVGDASTLPQFDRCRVWRGAVERLLALLQPLRHAAPTAAPKVIPTAPPPSRAARPRRRPRPPPPHRPRRPRRRFASSLTSRISSQPRAPGRARPPQAGQRRDGDFIVADGTEPASLDPAPGTGPFQPPLNPIYDGLTAWSDKMELRPALATSWEATPDGKTWTFKLRPGVKFHDGTPFTSQAVKVTVEHLLDAATGSSRRASYTLIKEVDDAGRRHRPHHHRSADAGPAVPDGGRLDSDHQPGRARRSSARISGGTRSAPGRSSSWSGSRTSASSPRPNPDYWGPKPQVPPLGLPPDPRGRRPGRRAQDRRGRRGAEPAGRRRRGAQGRTRTST